MTCRHCGADIADDSEFCSKCGKKIAEQADKDPEQTPADRLADGQSGANVEEDGGGEERLLWEGRLSWKAYGVQFLLLAVLGAVFLAIFITAWARDLKGLRYLGYGELVVWAALFLWAAFKVLKCKLTLRYRLSTQRLTIERGFFRKTIDEVELIRVDDVTVQQNIVQRMFNVGDVIVVSPTDATDPKQYLIGIRNPMEIKERIREHAQRRRKKSLHIEQL